MITDEHLKRNRELHIQDKKYGGFGTKYLPGILALINFYGINSLLDYGCGKGDLVRELRKIKPELNTQNYDPCVDEFSSPAPEPAEMVTCLHVLEHVEPKYLHDTIKYINGLAEKLLYFDLKDSFGPGPKFPDGGDSNTARLTAYEWYQILCGEFRRCKRFVINRKIFIKCGRVTTAQPPGKNDTDLGMVIVKC